MAKRRIHLLAALLILAAGAWGCGGCGDVDGELPSENQPDAGTTITDHPDAGPGPCKLDGQSLYGLWGTANGDEVWTAGEGGLAFHNTTRTNDGWQCIRTPVTRNLAAIWGSAANDIWFVGEAELVNATEFKPNVVVHWDGSNFTAVDTGIKASFNTVWGSASNDVWVGGYGGVLGHWDGLQWEERASGTQKYIAGIWGTAFDNIWAVGEEKTILRYDGISWKPLTTSTISKSITLTDVWGTGADNVYITGSGGTLLHWESSTLSLVNIPVEASKTAKLASVWGADPNNLRVVGDGGLVLRYWVNQQTQQGQWGTAVSPGIYGLTRVWGVSMSDFWIVGNYGIAKHFDH